jgi:hypothetical protein
LQLTIGNPETFIISFWFSHSFAIKSAKTFLSAGTSSFFPEGVFKGLPSRVMR